MLLLGFPCLALFVLKKSVEVRDLGPGVSGDVHDVLLRRGEFRLQHLHNTHAHLHEVDKEVK